MNHGSGPRVLYAVCLLGTTRCLLIAGSSALAQSFTVVHSFAGDRVMERTLSPNRQRAFRAAANNQG
jgi:hypothetical protein